MMIFFVEGGVGASHCVYGCCTSTALYLWRDGRSAALPRLITRIIINNRSQSCALFTSRLHHGRVPSSF
jgi:hypothetical protein